MQEIAGSVKITLNGDPFEVAGPLTVSALLSQLDIDSRRVAVEHNLVVLKRARYESTMIDEGDEVEIVNFVGGGGRIEATQTTQAPAAAATSEAECGERSGA